MKKTRFYSSFISISLVFSTNFTLIGCSSNIEGESDLVINKKQTHSLRQEQLEVDSERIKSKKNVFAKDDITPPVSEPLQDHLYESVQLVESGKPEEAVKSLKEEIKKNPKNSRAYSYLGKVHRAMEKYDEAFNCFDKAIKLQPKDPFPYCLKAETYYHREKYKDAIKNCNKALEIQSEYGHAYAIRGESYLQLKDYKNALTDLKKSASLNPSYTPVFIDLGDTNLQLKNYQEAVDQYTKAIELEADNGLFYARRAKAYKLLKDEDAFLKDKQKAAEFGVETVVESEK